MAEDPVQAPGQSPAGRPTLDGSRVSLQELNLDTGKTRGPVKGFLHKLNLFLAGMYTGESCAGTPHSERPAVSKDRKDP